MTQRCLASPSADFAWQLAEQWAKEAAACLLLPTGHGDNGDDVPVSGLC